MTQLDAALQLERFGQVVRELQAALDMRPWTPLEQARHRRTGYLQPIQPESGSGKGDHVRQWTADELYRARMMARLVSLGVTAQQAAKVARDPTCRWDWLADVMAACKAMQP